MAKTWLNLADLTEFSRGYGIIRLTMAKERGSQDPEALGYQAGEWSPAKHLVSREGQYTISQSYPDQSQHETVQFAVKREGYNEHIMRVDSYKEGYYSAYWHSSVSVNQFLTAAEEFLSHTDNSDKKTPSSANFDDEHTVQVFTLDEDHTDWSYTRPLTEQDLREGGAIPNDPQNLYLLRVNSPKASFCYEVAEKIIGVIAVPEQDTQSKIMQATASFAHKTQPALSEELVTSVLNRLPYNPRPNPPTHK